ncbi:RimJ/RimL family protein N-acetyltransferase [Novosphingobium sp. PhB165]|uniref:GNAT family N-acetyltransferase n=1 Tax=Novosphingobium sp. PhB165 TaxID=2485105 RepID=UPI00104DB2F4|nr:GNAT family protein [Novosphingobium sp. PhB165]TCM18760.1 RimJ/RimL family protein N-acetyltransferase [Novosphingobium sp. PhB165]
MAQLRTERLLLRPALPTDAEALHAIFVQPAAMAYWSRPPHKDLAETREWLDGMIAIPEGAGEDFIVTLNDRVIGKAGLWRFPEIGFILDPAFWGQGLAREALEAVIARAFAVHRLPQVHADVDPRNDRCLALLSRLGFRETGRAARTWQVGGVWCDSVYLRLDAADWSQRTA